MTDFADRGAAQGRTATVDQPIAFSLDGRWSANCGHRRWSD